MCNFSGNIYIITFLCVLLSMTEIILLILVCSSERIVVLAPMLLFFSYFFFFFFRGPKYDPELGHVYPVQLKQITKIESFLMMGPWALQGLYGYVFVLYFISPPKHSSTTRTARCNGASLF